MRGLWFVVIFYWAGQASAQEVLRLETLLSELRAKNPSIASAESWYDAARLQIKRSRALEDPQLTWMTEDISLQGEEGVTPMNRFQVNQMLPWPGKRSAMEKVAKKEADVYQARAAGTSLEIVASAKRLYYGLYLNQEKRRINREQRGIIDTLIELVTAQLSAGMPMHHDVLKMQTEAAMLDDDLLMLEAEQRMIGAMINGLLARPIETQIGTIAPAWSISQKLEEERLAKLAVENPDIQEMASMEQAELAMSEVARKEQYPDIMVGLFYDAYVGEGDMVGLMAGLNLPIWAKNKQRLDMESAELRAKATSQKRSAMESMLGAEVSQYIAMVRALEKRQVLLDQQLLPLAQQTFEASLATYPTGQTNALAVLDALRVVTEQRSALLALQVQRELALIELELRVGVPISELK